MTPDRPLTRRAPLSDIQPESGTAFTARTRHPHLSSHRRPSPARVLENGRPLPGPSNVAHDDVRRLGRGRFSFWYDYVYFSTSDNSDPRTNGRLYELEYPVRSVKAAALRLRDRLVMVKKSKPRISSAAESQMRIWNHLGFTLAPASKLLDFGCGAGECVDGFRRNGWTAFGCDVALPRQPVGALLQYVEQGIVRPIGHDPYRIPFDDDTFDMVFSITVFEHVMDYERALAEIARVLKPGGISVHAFPPPWRFLETHAFVPLASRFQWYWWLYLWARLGIRNQFQHGLSASQTACANYRFLKQETNYLGKARIREHVLRHFDECQFVEEAGFPGARYEFFRRHPRLLPIYRAWCSETRGRLLVCRGKKPPSALPAATLVA